jgi:hypothetical protein
MAVNLATGFNRTTGEPIDVLYLATGLVPYASVAAANAAIVSGVRYIGQFVNITNQLYWYGAGITDPDLVLLTSGGTVSFINPLPTTIAVGGYPLGSTFTTAQNMQDMWNNLLYPYTAPTLTLVSLTPASPQPYNQTSVACTVTFNWLKTAGTPDLVSADIQYRRGGAGAWTSITTVTSPLSPYTGVSSVNATASVTVNTSGADNSSINFQCIWIDTSQTNITASSNITFSAYAAPTAALVNTTTPAKVTVSKFLRSFTTWTDNTISGTISRNSPNINLSQYKIQRSYDNSSWTDLTALTAIAAGGGTLAANGGNVIDTTAPTNRAGYYSRAFVTDTQVPAGQVVSSTSSFLFYQPFLFGVSSATTPAAVNVSLLSNVPNSLTTNTGGAINYTNTSADKAVAGLVFNTNNDRFCFAYDNSYGAITTFYDTVGNLNLYPNFTSTTQVVTFGDGTTVTYVVFLYSLAVTPNTWTINIF